VFDRGRWGKHKPRSNSPDREVKQAGKAVILSEGGKEGSTSPDGGRKKGGIYIFIAQDYWDSFVSEKL